ncbi:hypothetical protein [Shigella sonnei]
MKKSLEEAGAEVEVK